MIPLCRPSIGQDEFKKIQEVLISGWLTHGPFNEEFEESFAKYIGVGYAQTINSCASALFIALKALNITGEVIIPSFTFVATAHAVVLAGAKPVFADVDYNSGNITAQMIEPLITDKTQAVIPVHFSGQSCKMDEIVELCEKHKLVLIEDSAEAIGATYKNRKTGSFGIGCFSFFPTKNMTTGEGGMITTNDAELAHKIKVLISHGIDKTTNTKFPWQREAVTAGYNLRMSGILAGLGMIQLQKLDQMNAKRREHAKYLSDNLSGDIETPKETNGCHHVYQMYTIKVKPEIRNAMVEELKKSGIGVSVHFSPAVHQQAYYKNYNHENLANTQKLSESIITLPMFPDLTKDDLDYIIKQTNDIFKKLNN
ncbi:MAG: DegT/DnrJ/EryC1/StrS family aminotransferase [Candidatus Buchananbacteria bacterium]|nr:DegT/DnrJ/EryC1/StrS family aminotransferase [Candidatus Buchananbacteria bacterium]